MNVRHYGKFRSPLAVPSLTDIQTRSFAQFLQADVPFNRRPDEGLEAILRETFPIFSYDKTVSLEYVGYELGRPRYNADECRVLGVTYGMPFKILVRLEKPEPVEEWVYLGEIPIMVGGGEFIINGSERVIVSQLQSPRRTCSRSRSTRRAGSRRPPSCGPCPRTTEPTNRSSRCSTRPRRCR
jgi:DNA-directed RNA polymerase subunit beta